ncbi:MAG: cytochrome-c oxidase, cbb3-type subunit III [Gammaproteobacteria bacterium]
MSDFWSFWIIAIVTINLGGCAWLIWWTAKPIKGEPPTGESMGHSFDGIEEYNNPMPRWWLGLFWATIVFAVVYLVLYPGFGKWQGLLGWTSQNQWEAEVQATEARIKPLFDAFAARSVEELAHDPEAVKVGQRLFLTNCAVCHGSNATGSVGFPNLTDGDWLYGSTPEAIKASIANGRVAAMPAWLGTLGDEGVNEVAHYVASLSRPEIAGERPELVAAGGPKFQTNCAMCHGADAKGNHLFGAPNLTDNVWLYGGNIAKIRETITHGRFGVMPAQEGRLSPEQIHVLTAYVYGLSHKQ